MLAAVTLATRRQPHARTQILLYLAIAALVI
jgi:hypothetical protein